jgi:mevalonate kinase
MPGGDSPPDPDLEGSNLNLKNLLDYLDETGRREHSAGILELGRLAADIRAGLAFRSDIPRNYGTGSSGALVAALYQSYRQKPAVSHLPDLRNRLAFIESAFHRKSSGIDPLVSYLGKAVFIRNGEILCSDRSLEELRGYLDIDLIDSGMPGMTGPGVEKFISGDLPSSQQQLFENEYIPLVNNMTGDILNGSFGQITQKALEVTRLQLELFPGLFTPGMSSLAREGLDSGKFALKLCGSGGGGYYLRLRGK